MRFRAPSFDPCLYFVFRDESGALGAFATHIGDIFGCGGSDFPGKIQVFAGYRPGETKVQASSFVCVDMEFPKRGDFSAKSNQEEFTKNLKPPLTSPELWAARQQPLSPEALKLRRRKSGEVCWLATYSRPDSRARLVRIAFQDNSLQGSGVSRINNLVKTAGVRQQATT